MCECSYHFFAQEIWQNCICLICQLRNVLPSNLVLKSIPNIHKCSPLKTISYSLMETVFTFCKLEDWTKTFLSFKNCLVHILPIWSIQNFRKHFDQWFWLAITFGLLRVSWNIWLFLKIEMSKKKVTLIAFCVLTWLQVTKFLKWTIPSLQLLSAIWFNTKF